MSETELSGPGWTCVWPSSCELGEGPIWVAREASLWFVDIETPAIHRYDPATAERRSFTPPWRVGSLAPCVAGGFIAGTEAGLALIDPVAGRWEVTAKPEGGLPGNRFNDGKVDPAGRFWAGTMDSRQKASTGSLYRVDKGLRWTAVDGGYGVTNGPAFSPDGRVMYHNDSATGTTFVFDLDVNGNATGKRVFAQWPKAGGVPDGLTVDADGCLWMAFWGGWCLRRVSPEAKVLAEHPLPAANITSAAFAGPAMDRLFVTSARSGLDADALEAQPLAGALFEIDAGGARGCPPVEYAA